MNVCPIIGLQLWPNKSGAKRKKVSKSKYELKIHVSCKFCNDQFAQKEVYKTLNRFMSILHRTLSIQE